MTPNEAIELFTRPHFYAFFAGPQLEAIDLAIEALGRVERPAAEIRELQSRVQMERDTQRSKDTAIGEASNFITLQNVQMDDLKTENERLRKERDALMDELKGICWACKNQKPWKMSVTGDTVACEHLAARGVVAAGGRAGKNCEHWQWRGPEGSE